MKTPNCSNSKGRAGNHRDPRPLNGFSDRKLVNLGSVPSSCWTKPTACWTWASCRPFRASWSIPADRQTLFFSATIEKSVGASGRAARANPVRIQLRLEQHRPVEQMDLHVYEVERPRSRAAAIHAEDQSGSFLVFARTKHGTDRLAKQFAQRRKDCRYSRRPQPEPAQSGAQGFQDG